MFPVLKFRHLCNRNSFALTLAALLVACSPAEPEPDETVLNVDENLATENIIAESDLDVAARTPAHLYAVHEGDLYGYVTAVSDEEQKRGVGAGKVIMFRYEGSKDGVYGLTEMSGYGTPVASYECTRPCVAIKAYTNRGVERWAFSSTSIVGSAFTDAFAGQLRPYRRPTPPSPAQEAPEKDSSDDALDAAANAIENAQKAVDNTIDAEADR